MYYTSSFIILINDETRKNKFNYQEKSWIGSFGNEYIKRNSQQSILESNQNLFSKILESTKKINSILELGCNIGLNLESLNRISTKFELSGIEINKKACEIAKKKILLR